VSKVQREHHKRKYLRLSEVAEILGVHYTTVYYAVKKGKIPSRRINSTLAPPPGTAPVPAKVTLDAFIISTTPYDVLIKQRPDMDKPKALYEQKHVLFLEDKNWPAKMLTKAVFGGDGDENVL